MKPSRRLASQRLSTLLLVLLTTITCGLWVPIWYWQRRSFFDAITRDKKLGSMPYVLLGVNVVSLVVLVVEGIRPSRTGADAGGPNLFGIASGLLGLMLAFRGKAILEQYFSRIGKPRRLSTAATFFFQLYYLQYKINEAADELAASVEARHEPANPHYDPSNPYSPPRGGPEDS